VGRLKLADCLVSGWRLAAIWVLDDFDVGDAQFVEMSRTSAGNQTVNTLLVVTLAAIENRSDFSRKLCHFCVLVCPRFDINTLWRLHRVEIFKADILILVVV